MTSNWHAVSGNLPIFVSTLNSILALLPLIVIASPFSSRPFTVLILLKFSPRSHDKHHWCPLQARNLRLRGAREGWRSCSQFCLSREGVQSEWGRRRPSCKTGEEATCRKSTVSSDSHLETGHAVADQRHLDCFKYS